MIIVISIILILVIIIIILVKSQNKKILIKNRTTIHLKPMVKIDDIIRGLMFRKNKLIENQGALFIFNYKINIGMWMKNTYIPLDLLILNDDFIVIDYIENMKPLDTKTRHISKVKSRYAIEVNGGFVKKNNIKIGTKVDPLIIKDLN